VPCSAQAMQQVQETSFVLFEVCKATFREIRKCGEYGHLKNRETTVNKTS